MIVFVKDIIILHHTDVSPGGCNMRERSNFVLLTQKLGGSMIAVLLLRELLARGEWEAAREVCFGILVLCYACHGVTSPVLTRMEKWEMERGWSKTSSPACRGTTRRSSFATGLRTSLHPTLIGPTSRGHSTGGVGIHASFSATCDPCVALVIMMLRMVSRNYNNW